MDKRSALEGLKLERAFPAGQQAGLRQARSSKVWVLACALIIGAVVASVIAWGPSKTVVVKTFLVQGVASAGQQVVGLNASGYVVAQQQATVAAQTTGLITAVYVQEGDLVSKGQILAQLDQTAAQAAASASEGQLQADTAIIPQYEAQADRDRIALKRSQFLSEQGAISKSALDNAVAAAKVSEAALARGLAQLEVDRNNLEVNKANLSYNTIRAPFSGVVTERFAHPGEMISPQAVGGFTQTGICTLVDMNSLEIDVDAKENYISRVHPGETVDAVLDAYPDWHIAGHVIKVVPTANQQKGTVKVRVAFENLDPRILPQMSVQVSFKMLDGQAATLASTQILIPRGAVKISGSTTTIFKVVDGHAKKIAIQLESAGTDNYRVLSGLAEGDRIVISPPPQLKDNQGVASDE